MHNGQIHTHACSQHLRANVLCWDTHAQERTHTHTRWALSTGRIASDPSHHSALSESGVPPWPCMLYSHSSWFSLIIYAHGCLINTSARAELTLYASSPPTHTHPENRTPTVASTEPGCQSTTKRERFREAAYYWDNMTEGEHRDMADSHRLHRTARIYYRRPWCLMSCVAIYDTCLLRPFLRLLLCQHKSVVCSSPSPWMYLDRH